MVWNWHALRNEQATCPQLVTWNDYTENTNIAPAHNARYSIYDLTGYHLEWWRTGKQPVPDHDRVYVTHPKASPGSKVWPFKGDNGQRAIEVQTILTAPGPVIVEVERDGKVVLRLESPEPITDRRRRRWSDGATTCRHGPLAAASRITARLPSV